jgi:hypothetical protein
MTRYEWVRTIVEDPDHPGEMILDLGDEICKHLGWQEGDAIEWIDNKDGTWTLRKKKL